MYLGIGAGLLSVVFICSSYIFSREYVRRCGDPVKLAVYSQLIMALGGIGMLIYYFSTYSIRIDSDLIWMVAGQVVFFLLGQISFFAMLRRVESSRASSLLGLKILVIAVITFAFGKNLCPMQWLAVVLCTISAVGMNFSGGKIPLASCLWLALSVISYALCDMCVTKLMKLMPGESMFINSLGVIGICYTAIGIAVLPLLFLYRVNKKEMKVILPYSLFYFLSMIFLYTCFGLIGVVFGSIIQSGRGILSVLIAVVLVKLRLDRNEKRVSTLKWIQRFVFAVVMLVAMVIYSLNA